MPHGHQQPFFSRCKHVPDTISLPSPAISCICLLGCSAGRPTSTSCPAWQAEWRRPWPPLRRWMQLAQRTPPQVWHQLVCQKQGSHSMRMPPALLNWSSAAVGQPLLPADSVLPHLLLQTCLAPWRRRREAPMAGSSRLGACWGQTALVGRGSCPLWMPCIWRRDSARQRRWQRRRQSCCRSSTAR